MSSVDGLPPPPAMTAYWENRSRLKGVSNYLTLHINSGELLFEDSAALAMLSVTICEICGFVSSGT